MLAEPKYRV